MTAVVSELLIYAEREAGWRREGSSRSPWLTTKWCIMVARPCMGLTARCHVDIVTLSVSHFSESPGRDLAWGDMSIMV